MPRADVNGMKVCCRCGERKPVERFCVDAHIAGDGLKPSCKACNHLHYNAKAREVRAKNVERFKGITPPEMRTCTQCGETKPRSGFHKKVAGPDGLTSWCKVCIAAYAKRYAKANSARISARNKAYGRAYRIKTKYGMTEADYDAMFEKQDGRCAVCGDAAKNPLALRIDHDHATGRIRGLLCNACNLGLGLLGDSETTLKGAILYRARNRLHIVKTS